MLFPIYWLPEEKLWYSLLAAAISSTDSIAPSRPALKFSASGPAAAISYFASRMTFHFSITVWHCSLQPLLWHSFLNQLGLSSVGLRMELDIWLGSRRMPAGLLELRLPWSLVPLASQAMALMLAMLGALACLSQGS